MFEIIVPTYNSSPNLGKLIESVITQSNSDWRLHIICDTCSQSFEEATQIAAFLEDNRINVIFNTTRKYALRNIVTTINETNLDDESIIAIIDGDDQLCDKDCFKYISRQYEDTITEDCLCEKGCSVLWTGHKWDDRDLNVSQFLPENENPYTFPWVSSHLRTFKRGLLKKINPDNFKDDKGQWFKRGYDQALMLPILYYCYKNNLKTCYLPRISYIYNHAGSATPKEEHTGGKLEEGIAQFIRQRGYIPT